MLLYIVNTLPPFYFQCYSLAVIGYRVATFNDCVDASEELKQVRIYVCFMNKV